MRSRSRRRVRSCGSVRARGRGPHRGNAIAVLSFVALVIGLGAVSGTDHLIAARMTTEIEGRVRPPSTVEQDLPGIVAEEMSADAPEMMAPVQDYLGGMAFSQLVEGSLTSAVATRSKRKFPTRCRGSWNGSRCCWGTPAVTRGRCDAGLGGPAAFAGDAQGMRED